MQLSFGSMEMMQRIRKDSTLSKVNLFINWDALRPQLTGPYKRESSHAGGQSLTRRNPGHCLHAERDVLGIWVFQRYSGVLV